jgi:outer membrane receptor protein involved in Fe transport
MARFHTVAAALATTACMMGYATEAQAQVRQYAIPPGPLKDALNAYAAQSGTQLLYQPNALANAQSRGVSGTLSSREALDRILSGSGFRAVTDRSGALAIVGNGQSASADSSGEGNQREVIVVTGTNIRGRAPAGSNLIVIDHQQIERSGYTTTEQLMHSLPQNFTGGAENASSEGSNFGAGGSGANVTQAAGANLRGLGAGATLTLVNGRRMAGSTRDGSFFDISTLPIEAIDRVEVLPDGASAIYGADAIGGVVNFILKKQYDGARTDFSYGFATEGGRKQYRAAQTIGFRWKGGGVFVNGSYLHESPVYARDRDATKGVIANDITTIYPRDTQKNLFIAANQDFGRDLSVNVDAQYVDFDRFNSFDGSSFTFFFTSHSKRYGGGGTITYRFAPGWELSAIGSASEEKNVYPIDVFLKSAGVRARSADSSNTQYQWSGQTRLTGTLFPLPGGDLKIAAGVEYRREYWQDLADNGVSRLEAQVRRNVSAVYAELAAPVLKNLDLSLALRHDHYSDFGGTTNPKIGVTWRVTPEFSLRSSYGTSFRAPATGYESRFDPTLGATNIWATVVANPSGGSPVPIVQIGGSQALRPEKAKTFTIGGTYEPQAIPGLRGGISYYNIKYTNRIVTPQFTVNALSDPAAAGLITLFPNNTALIAALNSLVGPNTTSILDFTTFQTGLGAPGFQNVVYLYDLRQLNAASERTNGLDFNLDYSHALAAGTIRVSLNATYIFNLERKLFPGSALEQLVDTFANPVDFRGRVQLGWGTPKYDLALAVNYTDPYANNRTVVIPERVRANTTIDLNARYSILGFDLGLSAVNVLDKKPPHISNSISLVHRARFDSANASVLGRTITFRISKKWL